MPTNEEVVLGQIVASALDCKQTLNSVLTPALKSFADTNIPLDVRWELYVQLDKADLLKTRSYGDGFVNVLGDYVSLYDDFYTDRYTTRSYWELYAHKEKEKYEELRWDAWREKVLSDSVAKGYGSFVYDW